MAQTTIQLPEKVSEKLGKFPGTKGEAVARLVQFTEFNTRALTLSREVPPETKARYVEEIPIDGTITNISIQFPEGCNFLVGVQVSVENTAIFPSKGYIAKDGFDGIFNVDNSVQKGQKLYISIKNQDDTYSHEITVDTVIVGGRE